MMRHTPSYMLTDHEEVKRLVRDNPWATFVSATSRGLVASHYPVMLDETTDDFAVVSHFGRPDDRLHELGQHEVLVIIQGPHDYISPSWYSPGEVIATWNHVTAHLYGIPEILSEADNYAALSRLTDHFEGDRPGARRLADNEPAARRGAKGTVGLRVRVERFDARAKLSQNKSPAVIENITAHVAELNPLLAEEMRRVQRQG